MEYVQGLVSVVIPTYRRTDMLERALDSVLNQTYSNIELLLVDDNQPGDEYSSALAERVLRYSSDQRFRLITQEKHINGAAARNVGIRIAKGEYVAFLDDDDWWEPNKIDLQVRAIRQLDDSWGAVSCQIKRYNKDKLVALQPAYRDGKAYKDILMLVSDFSTGTLLVRRKALDDTGYFDESLFRHQDLQLLINLCYKYKIKQVHEYLHCRDVSDAQNRPNVEKIIEAKKNLFVSVSPVLDTLKRSELRRVLIMNRAEVGYVRLRNGDYVKGLLDFLPLFSSPYAFVCEVKKTRDKVWSVREARRCGD